MLTQGGARPPREPAIHRESQGTDATRTASGASGSRTAGTGFAAYRRLVVAQPLVFVLYVALALGGPWLGPPGYKAGETFPFFDWSLFSSPLRERSTYSVRILAAAGPDAAAAPLVGRVLALGQADFLSDIRFQKSATALARAVRAGDRQAIARHAGSVGNFLAPLGVDRYELVALRYDPLAFVRDSQAYVLVVITRQRVEARP